MGRNRRITGASALLALALVTGAAPAQEAGRWTDETVRGWQVAAEVSGGRFAGCAMFRESARVPLGFQPATDRPFGLRLVGRGGGWFMEFPSDDLGGARLRLSVDLDGATQEVELVARDGYLGMAVSDGWLRGLAAANVLGLTWLGMRHEIALDGSAAAIGVLRDCVAEEGRATPPTWPPPRPARPAPGSTLGPDCPMPGAYDLRGGFGPAQVTLRNRTSGSLDLARLTRDGRAEPLRSLWPGESATFPANLGEVWIARDFLGRCIGGALEITAPALSFELTGR